MNCPAGHRVGVAHRLGIGNAGDVRLSQSKAEKPTRMDWIGWAAGGVMSVLTGLVTWYVTRLRAQLDEKRRMKRDLLTELIANRFDLRGEAFSRAINAVPVVFADSPSVMSAVHDFHAGITADERDAEKDQTALLRLLRELFKDLRLSHGNFSDEFLLRPFNTRRDSAIKPTRPMRLVTSDTLAGRPVFKPNGIPALSGGGLDSFGCPSCGVTLLAQVPEQFALGMVIQCPNCGSMCDLA